MTRGWLVVLTCVQLCQCFGNQANAARESPTSTTIIAIKTETIFAFSETETLSSSLSASPSESHSNSLTSSESPSSSESQLPSQSPTTSVSATLFYFPLESPSGFLQFSSTTSESASFSASESVSESASGSAAASTSTSGSVTASLSSMASFSESPSTSSSSSVSPSSSDTASESPSSSASVSASAALSESSSTSATSSFSPTSSESCTSSVTSSSSSSQSPSATPSSSVTSTTSVSATRSLSASLSSTVSMSATSSPSTSSSMSTSPSPSRSFNAECPDDTKELISSCFLKGFETTCERDHHCVWCPRTTIPCSTGTFQYDCVPKNHSIPLCVISNFNSRPGAVCQFGLPSCSLSSEDDTVLVVVGVLCVAFIVLLGLFQACTSGVCISRAKRNKVWPTVSTSLSLANQKLRKRHFQEVQDNPEDLATNFVGSDDD